MDVKVIREACCAADDQLGPLEAVYRMEEQSSLSDLVEKIRVSRFLQFSSTHDQLTGEVDGVAVVEAHSGGSTPQFHVAPTKPVASAIGSRTLYFRFRQAG